MAAGARWGRDFDPDDLANLETRMWKAYYRRQPARLFLLLIQALRALWTEEEAWYAGEFVSFGPSWAFPKPVQPHIPLIIGAGGGPKTFQWIARHADGWMTTPTQTDISGQLEKLKAAWVEEGRAGVPDIRVLIALKPDPADLMAWAEAGVSELIWGVPDKSEDDVLTHLDKLAGRLELQTTAG